MPKYQLWKAHKTNNLSEPAAFAAGSESVEGNMYRDNMRKITVALDGRMTPFKITDNVYFVGTYQASVHLIDTGEGYILIDTGYENTFDMVVSSIKEMGFDLSDIKYILNTHWHGDHTEASGMMATLTGAKNVISRIDAYEIERLGYFKPDVLVDDGDVLILGNTEIKLIHTPGHTKGTMSLTFETTVNGEKLVCGMHGGAGANSLVPSFATYYEGCREDYLASCERLLGIHVDVFIGNHVWNNDTYEKYLVMQKTGDNPFVESEEWVRFIKHCIDRCNSLPPL